MRLPKKIDAARRKLVVGLLRRGDRAYTDEELRSILFKETGWCAGTGWLNARRAEAVSMDACLEDSRRVSDLVSGSKESVLASKVREAIAAWRDGDVSIGAKLIEIGRMVGVK